MHTLLLLLLLSSLAGGLTIYRIGGEGLPLPDAAEYKRRAVWRGSAGLDFARAEVVVDAHRAVIDLPRLQGQVDSNRPVEVFFKARVFRMGTEFTGELFDSDRSLSIGCGWTPTQTPSNAAA